MASYRPLDASGRPAIRPALAALLSCALFVLAPAGCAQSEPQFEAKIHQLFEQQRWLEIVNLVSAPGPSPDVDLAYGIALARLERWAEARRAFESGLRLRPRDPRFMVELGGVAFKQANYPDAQSWIRRALRLEPDDAYNLEFLATVFYLEGNLEAALKYWNRIVKPQIASFTFAPAVRLNPILLDRAITFSPAGTLELRDLASSEARIDQLDIFSAFRFDLEARPDERFELRFDNIERNGCGSGKWECLFRILGQLPAQTVNFDYFNIRHAAVNFQSSYRWDSEKRRLRSSLEAPLEGKPQWHLGFSSDIRNENWALRSSFSGQVPLVAALNLKREAVSAQFTDVVSGRSSWSTETEFSRRSYHNVYPGHLLTPGLLTPGSELKQAFRTRRELFELPERRFAIDSSGSLEVAGLWSSPGRSFAHLQGSLRLHWFPQATGQRYEIEHLFRAGRTVGQPPFDELFTLGVLGDTDLLMKAHIATRDGKKGTSPLGGNYFLSNWEATRNFSPLPLLGIKIGPFVDTGKITDPNPILGSHKWLWDVGLETKVQVLGLAVVLSYGRDLRSGRNALVAASR
jgi:tetratricopeptide (TPR) repeat protein